MTSPRHYIYSINSEGTWEFLHTALDEKGCREYIKSHMKVFPNRFVEYRYGQMCYEQDTWKGVRND